MSKHQAPVRYRHAINQGGQHGARDGTRKLDAARQRKERKRLGNKSKVASGGANKIPACSNADRSRAFLVLPGIAP
jgi:hypothetical protein